MIGFLKAPLLSHPMLKSGLPARGLLLASVAIVVSGCGGGYAHRQTMASAHDNSGYVSQGSGTVLDVHVASPVGVESRMALSAAQGAQGLTGQEYGQVSDFAADYVRAGRGNVVISIPTNAGNSQSAAMVAQDAQRALYAAGVDYSKISSGTYQAQGQPNASVLISFERYEARKLVCEPWTATDATKTNSNLSPRRFGCAQNANLAAMLADPGDLLSDRKDPSTRDAKRLQVGFEKNQKGEVATPGAAVAGAQQ